MTNLKVVVYTIGFLVFGFVALNVINTIQATTPGAVRQYQLENERRELENEARRHELELQRQKDLATAPAAVAVPYVALFAVMGGLGLFGAIVYKTKYQHPLIKHDQHGRLPVARSLVSDLQLTHDQMFAMMMQTNAQAAATQLETARALQRLADEVKISITDRGMPAPQLLPAPTVVETTPDDMLMLPDNIGMQEVLSQALPNNLVYGVLPNGSLLQAPLQGAYHGLRAGDTRTGKSNAIDCEIVQLHYMAARGTPMRLYAADFKRELKATWQRSPLFEGGVESDPAGVINILDFLVHGTDGILARQDMFGRVAENENRIIRNVNEYQRVTGETLPLSIMFIDELNSLFEGATNKERQELERILTIALQTGAASGIYLQGGAQHLTAATLPRSGANQFVNRQYFGQWSGSAINMLFGQAKDIDENTRKLVTGGKGRGLVRLNASGTVQAFQALRCDESDIIGAVELFTKGRQSVTPQSNVIDMPLQSPERPLIERAVNMTQVHTITPDNAVESVDAGNESAEITVSSEERAAIVALAKAGIKRGAICQQLFGSPNGRPYKQVKLVLDKEGIPA